MSQNECRAFTLEDVARASVPEFKPELVVIDPEKEAL